MEHFISGATRSTTGIERFDLVCPTAVRRVAAVMGEGAVKYGVHNWSKGIPNSNSLDHAMKHLNAYLNGDRHEDHLGHAICNIMFIIHFNHDCSCAGGHELLEATNL